MRNGKVERLWIQNESGLIGVFNVRKMVLDYQPEGYDEKTPLGPRYIEVMPVEDHERIVAELRAEVERLNTELTSRSESLRQTRADWLEARAEVERLKRANQVVPRDAELLALNGKFRDTIATQSKVIEKIKTIAEEMNCTCGGRYSESTYRGDVLEIIERGAR